MLSHAKHGKSCDASGELIDLTGDAVSTCGLPFPHMQCLRAFPRAVGRIMFRTLSVLLENPVDSISEAKVSAVV